MWLLQHGNRLFLLILAASSFVWGFLFNPASFTWRQYIWLFPGLLIGGASTGKLTTITATKSENLTGSVLL